MSQLVDKLRSDHNLSDAEFKALLTTDEYDMELYKSALDIRELYYGNEVYVRGLIEISNYCRNDCYYCGIRHSNSKADRYRLTPDEIMCCCDIGYELGFRTFVLQGGEDPWFTDKVICQIVTNVKSKYPDCAVTLSLGEKNRDSYKAYYDAGADRYLLRHETANNEHYGKLHPDNMSLDNRKRCLYDLKSIGYATGAGFMVGSPYQTIDCIIDDLRFLQELNPDMIGIGPYLRHKDTPFAKYGDGDLKLSLRLISVLRHIFPNVLLPSTTAMGTIHPQGREMGMLAGANVVMPNLSPTSVRSKYELYDDKICTGDEAAECRDCLSTRMESIGMKIVTSRGDKVGKIPK